MYLANQYIFRSDQARLLPEGFSFGSNLILTHENYLCYHYDADDHYDDDGDDDDGDDHDLLILSMTV